MKTIPASPLKVNYLGRLGENERLRLAFDISADRREFPGATFTLFNKGPGDASSYPCAAVEIDGDTLYWTITSAELRAEGRGQCERIVTVGSVVAKSIIYDTQVLTALDNSGDAPEPWDSWQTQFAGMVSDAQTAATAAEKASEAAEDASQAVQDMGVSSTTLSPGTSASVVKTVDAQTGAVTLTFGIPQGAQGEQGPQGEPGPKGDPGISEDTSGIIITL